MSLLFYTDVSEFNLLHALDAVDGGQFLYDVVGDFAVKVKNHNGVLARVLAAHVHGGDIDSGGADDGAHFADDAGFVGVGSDYDVAFGAKSMANPLMLTILMSLEPKRAPLTEHSSLSVLTDTVIMEG